MWVVDDPARFTRASTASHQVSIRLEAWSQGVEVDEMSFTDGDVTDTWVSVGVRRALDLTVQPSRAWQRLLALPLVELRPFRGIRFSRSSVMEVPCGRFPILPGDQARPLSAIKISADDYYQGVIQADLSYPVQTDAKRATDAIAELLTPFAGPAGRTNVTATNTSEAAATLLEKSRHDAIVDYAKSFGLEVFIDRLGVPTIGDVQVLGTASTDLLAGPGGAVESMTVKPDWDKVYNQVSVSTTAQDVEFPAQVAVITDPKHPAAPWRIGYRVLKMSSPLLLTAADAMTMAQTVLIKAAGAAETYQYNCMPDARRAAGDSVLGATMTGTSTFQIKSVTTPLRADGRQVITTINTQLDYT